MGNSHIRGKETTWGIVTKLCMWLDIRDVIMCAAFGDDRLMGLGVATGKGSNFTFPHWLASSPLQHSHYRASVWYEWELLSSFQSEGTLLFVAASSGQTVLKARLVKSVGKDLSSFWDELSRVGQYKDVKTFCILLQQDVADVMLVTTSIYPKPFNRTNRYKSFINYALTNYQ